ncbi:MAG: pilus assembly protein TadE [Massilia sp.]|nr:pilus assembly protein TadE [Massilia sp.]
MRDIDWNRGCPRADARHESRSAFFPERQVRRCGERQRGAMTIMFTLAFMALVGFIGLGLDLAMLYNRKAELQGMADATALAAARELIGTNAGVTKALSQASSTASKFQFQYSSQAVEWSDAALQFSATGKAGSWVDASSAAAAPAGLMFAKVETGDLAPELNAVDSIFMGMLSSSLTTSNVYGRAIAGRASVKVTPLGICALSATPENNRINAGPPSISELEEYGFRRGVGYNLMKLNPNGLLPEFFFINPIDPIGTLGASVNTSPALMTPYVCAGTMPMPSVMKNSAGMSTPISVSRPFPITVPFNQLNSRFDLYSSASSALSCSPNSAPPDANVKAYVKSANLSWMSPSTDSARTQDAGLLSPLPLPGKLWSITSPLPAPAASASQYGPLWSYARAVAYASPQPTNGYTTLAVSTWPTLYPTDCTPACPLRYVGTSFVTPYMSSNGSASFQAPTRPGLRNRRVLNIPLLSCPVAAGTNVTANVLAIGRFFMTVPATSSSVSAEFAGVVAESTLGGAVELYP